MTQAWFVRAGRDDEFADHNFAQGQVAIGWRSVGDLTGVSSRTNISLLVRSAYPGISRPTLDSYAVQLYVFRLAMRPGDIVVMLRTMSPELGIGRISGEYEYLPTGGVPHVRSINWLYKDFRRSQIPELSDPPALSAVYRIGNDAVLQRLRELAGDGAAPILGPPEPSESDEIDTVARSAAYRHLSRNLNYARNLTSAGSHLEVLRVSLFEVTDVYRAAWVQSVAALDHWVHQEIGDRMLRLAENPQLPRPPGYQRFELPLNLVEQIQFGQLSLRDAVDRGVRTSLAYKTYQSPDKIQEGLGHVGDVKNLWQRVAKVLNERVDTADTVTGQDVQARLREIVHRRNKIAHEYDEDPENPPSKRAIDAAQTMQTIDWLDQLANALLVVLDQE